MERNQSPAEKVKFAEALHKVIEYLQGEPLLLFVLGAVIVLAVAAVSGSQNLWTLILPVILAIAGLLGWIFLETRKNPDSHLRARYEIRSRNLRANIARRRSSLKVAIPKSLPTIRCGFLPSPLMVAAVGRRQLPKSIQMALGKQKSILAAQDKTTR